jgi:hypothetical protein
MNPAQHLPVNSNRRKLSLVVWLGLAMGGLSSLHGSAAEKVGMPDLAQIEQTCLPTATTNLLVWFGQHGYPKLIAPGDSKDDGFIHTVHHVMATTDANFDWGTRPELVVDGIKKYIEAAGYECDVEFRGLGKAQFTQDWLKENDQPNKGFVLLLAYCSYNPNNQTYSNAWNAGHAVTLVNAEKDMILIHDPAHMEDEVGRKVLTPEVLTQGSWQDKEGYAPVTGLMLLSGSMLDAPPNSQVMLIGAVCVTMLPDHDKVASSTPVSGAAPTIGGDGGSPAPSSTPPSSAPVSTTKSWTEWLFLWLFSK